MCVCVAGRLVPVKMDVRDAASISRVVEQLKSDLVGGSRLVGVVCNAGVGHALPFELIPMHDVRNLVEVNVFGVCEVIQQVRPTNSLIGRH